MINIIKKHTKAKKPMAADSEIVTGVSKQIPLKTKRRIVESEKQIDLASEFNHYKESVKGNTKNQHSFRVFTWSRPNAIEIESKGLNLLEKISKNHTIKSMPTHVILVESIKSLTYKLKDDSTFGELDSQKECQKLTIYTLGKEQVEKLAKKVNALDPTKVKKKFSPNF